MMLINFFAYHYYQYYHHLMLEFLGMRQFDALSNDLLSGQTLFQPFLLSNFIEERSWNTQIIQVMNKTLTLKTRAKVVGKIAELIKLTTCKSLTYTLSQLDK